MRQNITSMQTNLFPEGRTYPFFRFTQKRTLRKGFDPLTPRTPKKRKIGNFPFLAFRTHWIFSNGKVRPSCYFGKSRTSVYEWRPHNKNSKTFLPWLQAPIKILSGKNRAKRRPDFCFSNEKRGSVHYWKIITNLLGVKNQKKASEKGAKMGIFEGVFPCIYY